MLSNSYYGFLANIAVKYLHSLGLNVLVMSPAKNNYSMHNLKIKHLDFYTKYLLNVGN